MTSREVVVSSDSPPFAQRVEAGSHVFESDEPVAAGGSDGGPNPYDLLLAALGSCTSMTMQLYARRKGWPLERTRVRLTHASNHSEDCAECEGGSRRLERIERRIELAGPLDTAQRERLIAIAERCPVHQTLTGHIEIHTTLAAEDDSTRP